MVVKLILLFLALWFGLRLYRIFQARNNTEATPENIQDMVSCDKCGIHIPANEAIKSGNKYYCSQDHLTKMD